jgi:hypothetical protein
MSTTARDRLEARSARLNEPVHHKSPSQHGAYVYLTWNEIGALADINPAIYMGRSVSTAVNKLRKIKKANQGLRT